MQREVLLVSEMIEAAENARDLTADTDVEDLATDRQRRDALLWNFTVLGEAAAQLDDGVRGRFPDVDWTRPAQLRNRIVHGYWSIDLEILHTTATDILPGFVEQLRAVLAALETDNLVVCTRRLVHGGLCTSRSVWRMVHGMAAAHHRVRRRPRMQSQNRGRPQHRLVGLSKHPTFTLTELGSDFLGVSPTYSPMEHASTASGDPSVSC